MYIMLHAISFWLSICNPFSLLLLVNMLNLCLASAYFFDHAWTPSMAPLCTLLDNASHTPCTFQHVTLFPMVTTLFNALLRIHYHVYTTATPLFLFSTLTTTLLHSLSFTLLTFYFGTFSVAVYTCCLFLSFFVANHHHRRPQSQRSNQQTRSGWLYKRHWEYGYCTS